MNYSRAMWIAGLSSLCQFQIGCAAATDRCVVVAVTDGVQFYRDGDRRPFREVQLTAPVTLDGYDLEMRYVHPDTLSVLRRGGPGYLGSHLVTFDLKTGEMRSKSDKGLVGAGWSNDGDRVAVVEKDIGFDWNTVRDMAKKEDLGLVEQVGQALRDPTYYVSIRDSELKEIQRFRLEIRRIATALLSGSEGAPLQNENWTVSWNHDDKRIAVSKSIPQAVGRSLEAQPDLLRCEIIELSSGKRAPYEHSRVYFIGEDILVGSRNGSANNVWTMHLRQGNTEALREIQGDIPFFGDPRQGVFMISDRSPTIGEIYGYRVSLFDAVGRRLAHLPRHLSAAIAVMPLDK